MRPLIHNLSREELLSFFKQNNQPVFRANQVWRWLYVQKVCSWNEMTNIPTPLQQALSDNFTLNPASITDVSSTDDHTSKLLVELTSDSERVEEVLMPVTEKGKAKRATVCISSQAGCRFKCAFCASGQAGFSRNLEPGEMTAQVLLAMRESPVPITNVVFMGIGEPFDNYDNVLKAARILNDHDGLNIGARKITISTCGIIPGMERFSEESSQFELSISLHAPDNELRTQLMPVNKKYPLPDLMQAARKYTEKTNRIITFEYTLIKDINDSPARAEQLVKLLRGLHCRINLIPLSPVTEYDGKTSPSERTQAFEKIISSAGFNTTLRWSRGKDVNAACGQLRYKHNA